MPIETFDISSAGEPAGAVLVADGCGGTRFETPPAPAANDLCKKCGIWFYDGMARRRLPKGDFCECCAQSMTNEELAAEVGLDDSLIRQLAGTEETRALLETFILEQMKALEARFRRASIAAAEIEKGERAGLDMSSVREVTLEELKGSTVEVVDGRRRRSWFQLELEDGSLDPLSVCRNLDGLIASLEELRISRTHTYTIVQVGGFEHGKVVEVLERLEYRFDGRGRLRPARELEAANIRDDVDWP